MDVSLDDFHFWKLIEQDLDVKIPNHIKNNFNICGFNKGIIFQTVDDEDIAYVEDFVRTKISQLIEIHFMNNAIYDYQQHACCFFGEFTNNPLDFKYSVSEKWLIKQIVDHVNRIAQMKTNGGLSYFEFSPFDSKMKITVEKIPFFGKETESVGEELQNLPKTNFTKPVLLNKLISEAQKNDSRQKHGYRYDKDVKDIAAYLRMVGGKLAFETLQSNFLSALPSESTTRKYISETNDHVSEGVLRSIELLDYLKTRNLPFVVSLSEDATRISGRIQYDSKSNEIIGFVLPINKQTGMPIAHSFPARNAEEIFSHFKGGNSVAHFVNVVMAQPLADAPAFCVLVYGSDSKYSAEDVINRWNFIVNDLRKQNIAVLNISSDSDPKFNSAMRKSCLLGMDSNIIDKKWFKSGVELNSGNMRPIFVQDTPHIGTKVRNAFLKTIKKENMFPFGDSFFIRLNHVKYLMDHLPKDQHELTPTVINPVDRQNYESVLRMCDPKVTKLMKEHVPESDATVAFLEALRDINDAYKEINLKPLDRVEKMWYSVFILRIWREYVSSRNDSTLKENFLTMNCYSCIEINAHSLLLLILHLRETNQSHLFMTHLLDSQPCEHFFRKIRSFTTTYSTVANCSVQEILGRITKIHLQDDIANRSKFNFPRNKITNDNHDQIKIELPTKEEIIEQIEECKDRALKFAVKIKLLKKSKQASFDFECKIPLIQPKPHADSNNSHVKKEQFNGEMVLENIHLKNFAEKFVGQQIPEDSSYVRVMCDTDKEFVIKKTSLCWLLREEHMKLSSDRLQRVKAACNQNKK